MRILRIVVVGSVLGLGLTAQPILACCARDTTPLVEQLHAYQRVFLGQAISIVVKDESGTPADDGSLSHDGYEVTLRATRAWTPAVTRTMVVRTRGTVDHLPVPDRAHVCRLREHTRRGRRARRRRFHRRAPTSKRMRRRSQVSGQVASRIKVRIKAAGWHASPLLLVVATGSTSAATPPQGADPLLCVAAQRRSGTLDVERAHSRVVPAGRTEAGVRQGLR